MGRSKKGKLSRITVELLTSKMIKSTGFYFFVNQRRKKYFHDSVCLLLFAFLSFVPSQ